MDHLKQSFTTKMNALKRRPDLGRGTAITVVRITDGLTCEITEGPWRMVADMSPKSGGKGIGPTPGTMGRAALGACLAMTYKLWAAYRNIRIEALEVEIQGDYDARGMYDFDGVPAAYSELRYIVRIASPAKEADVLRLLDEAEKHTTFLEAFSQPQTCRRNVFFRQAAAKDATNL